MALDPRDLEQFISEARIKLPGSSENGIKAELYSVLREFFADSGSWREDIMFNAVANTTDYLIVPVEGGKIIRLIGVWDDKGIVIPAFMPTIGTIKLVHAVSNTPQNQWFARVEKSVTQPITEENVPVVPDWTLGLYYEHILDGLLGRMMAQIQKNFSNPTMSSYHLKRFRQGIKIARDEVNQAYLKGAQAWSYPQGFAKGSQRGGVSTAWPTNMF